MLRRHLLGTSLLLAAGGAAAQSAGDFRTLKPADFPARPIEFIVAFPAGGGMDVTARILAKHIERLSGHRVIVTNRTGGAGLVAHAYVARQAPADGYTVGILSSGMFSDSMLRAEGRWSHEDITPLAFLNHDPMTWIVWTQGPQKDWDIQRVLAEAKARPNTLRISVLPGRPYEFLVEQVERLSGTKFRQVPFQGGAPAITSLIGGHIEIGIGFYSEYRGQYEARLVKPIAVSGASRASTLPELPTFNELFNVQNILWGAWRFACVPKAVPEDRRRYLEALIYAALRDPETLAEFRPTGVAMDASIDSGEKTRAAVERLVGAEMGFYRETGRIR